MAMPHKFVIEETPITTTKVCSRCGRPLPTTKFPLSHSDFMPDKHSPLCEDCIESYLEAHGYKWDYVSKVCQYLDIPWIPREYEKLKKSMGSRVFNAYAKIFSAKEYNSLSWAEYDDEFRKLKAEGVINSELPLLDEQEVRQLKERWGANYDADELYYLENLFVGLKKTQTINGFLQNDQAMKLCKISLEIDSKIRAGEDFDKLLSSYDKLVKTGGFTPQNTKNASDFESVGELFHWLEKRGFKPQYVVNEPRDIVDETIKNIQNYNQKLYVNETGIGEEITRRIESLKHLTSDNHYDLKTEYDLDEYDNDGYKGLDEEFKADLDLGEEDE